MTRRRWMLVMADLHGLTPYDHFRVDAVLLAGDLCPDAHQLEQPCRTLQPCHLTGQRRFVERKLSALAELYGVPVVAVAGNHDFGLQAGPVAAPGVTILHDELTTLPNGATVWGSPWNSAGMAFSADDSSLAEHWDKCPAGVDILLTHVPPFGIGDAASEHIGSRSLLAAIERIRPRLHLFGHCHEDRGCWDIGGTLHVNCTLGSHDGWQSQHPPWRLCDDSWR